MSEYEEYEGVEGFEDEGPYFYTDLEEGDGPIRPDYEFADHVHDDVDFQQMPPADEDDPKNDEVY